MSIEAVAAESKSSIGLGSPVLDQLAISVLNERWLKRLKFALAVYGVGQFAFRTQRSVRHFIQSRYRYTLILESDDQIYPLFLRWMTDSLPETKHRVLAASTGMSRKSDAAVEPSDCSPMRKGVSRRVPTVGLFYDGEESLDIVVEGHKMTVWLTKADRTSSISKEMMVPSDKITVKCRTDEGRSAAVRLLQRIAEENLSEETIAHQPDVFVLGRWGDWNRRSEVPRRTLETVVLAEGQIEEIVGDMAEFLLREQDYGRLGQPWHRGYLFHGPPGTGKTSLAKALATHFDLDIYCVPLGDLTGDSNLTRVLSEIPARSILLLEDIDVFHASTNSTEKASGEGVTLSGLLNSLDGVATPHGLIKIMTTNHTEKLKAELTRKGRVDMDVLIDYINFDQFKRMFAIFYDGYKLELISEEYFNSLGPVVPSEIMETIKSNLDNPKSAEMAVQELMSSSCGSLAE